MTGPGRENLLKKRIEQTKDDNKGVTQGVMVKIDAKKTIAGLCIGPQTTAKERT